MLSSKKFNNPKLKLIRILDFENVAPLFRVPSCTITGVKGEENSYPVPLRRYYGVLGSKNLRLNKAEIQLKVMDGAYTPPIAEQPRSFYYDRFRMGARLAPRPFWFVDFAASCIEDQPSGSKSENNRRFSQESKRPVGQGRA
jgi:hypothetical protein